MTRERIETMYPDILASDEDQDQDLKYIACMLDQDLRLAYRPVPQNRLRSAIAQLVAEKQGSQPVGVSGPVPARLFTWWRQLRATRRTASVALVVAASLVTGGCLAYGSSQVIRVFLPEQGAARMGLSRNVTVPPDILDMPFVRYRPISPAVAARQSGLPIAYLPTAPPDLRGAVGTKVYLDRPGATTNTRVDLKVHSLVRYRGAAHTLIIELSEPPPAVIARYQLLLGEHTVHLPTGQPAWTTVVPSSYEPNQVAFVAGRYIVSVASDLSLHRIEQIASATTISPATARGHIPYFWPTPLPASRANWGVDIAMTGIVDHYVSADGKPGLQYFLRIGNRAMGQEQHEEITLILPQGITFADHGGRRRYAIPFGGNGMVGGTEALKVRDARVFDRGLTIRVTWNLRGVPGERTFYFPISSGPAPTPPAVG